MLLIESIKVRICDIVAEQFGLRRDVVTPTSRIIRDLHCDSLDTVELIMEIEDEFQIVWPDEPTDPATAGVFTRIDMTIADLAEVVYLRQGTGPPPPRGWLRHRPTATEEVTVAEVAPFTQFGGRWVADRRREIFEPLKATNGVATLVRRQTDGMICTRVPAAQVDFRDGDRLTSRHVSAYFIDVEPVSTSAYCRFLNTIGPVADRLLAEWFISAPGDGRAKHQLIEKVAAINPWQPVRGCERWPMILVSWYGANAYALWATGGDWYGYRDAAADGAGSALPTEDEWEYAARGPSVRRFPWGDADATPDLAAFGRHARGQAYPTPHSLPMEAVNRPLGLSPLGLRHMAGNVWQWCANELSPGIRAERGGSWIGPAFLCESSYRRGRVPDARGRCLGFRCVSRE